MESMYSNHVWELVEPYACWEMYAHISKYLIIFGMRIHLIIQLDDILLYHEMVCILLYISGVASIGRVLILIGYKIGLIRIGLRK